MAIKITWYDHYPNGNKEYTTDLTQLNGGLNIRDLPQHLKATESPKLENMWWENGVLAARPGQEQVGTAVLGRRWLKYAWPKTERVAEQVRVVMGTYSRSVTVLTFRFYEDNPVTNPAAEVVTFTLTQRPELTDTEVAELAATYMRGNYFQLSEGGPVYWVDSDTQVSYVGRGPTAGLYAVGAVLITDGPGAEAASVLDNDPNAYPTNGQQDGFWYIRQDDEEAYACSSEPFYGKVVAHVGAYMYWFDLGNPEVHQIAAGVPLNRGTFFRYQDYLFYKNRGGFYRISPSMQIVPVEDIAYLPTTFINCDPDTGAGDSYQPANLLNAARKVLYRPMVSTQVQHFTGDGANRIFAARLRRGDYLSDDYFQLGFNNFKSVSVSVAGVEVSESEYTVSTSYTGTYIGPDVFITFNTAPAAGADIAWTLSAVSGRYMLPGHNRELGASNCRVSAVTVNGRAYDPIGSPKYFSGDGTTKRFQVDRSTADPQQYPADILGVTVDGSGVSYGEFSYDSDTGFVTLASAPASGSAVYIYPCGYYAPFTISNQHYATIGPYDLWILPAPFPSGGGDMDVEVTYSLTGDAGGQTGRASLMSCPYAITGGGQDSLSILLGGSTTQPNAVYWNSNDSVSMNPGYFPDNYYQLVGDSDEFVTGFGRQYSDVIALKEHSLYKMQYEVLSVDDRDTLSFTFPSINGKIGCDLPWSIQLIENNLVFCNTYTGVHILLSSSAAYENNVECISRKVNGNPAAGATWGLLYDVRNSALPVVGYDDDRRYWLCANEHVYLWDYDVSGYKDPSWFYFTNVEGTAYFRDEEHRTHHFSAGGRITVFNFQAHSDYGEAFRKVYQTPVLYFGQYNYLKDVRSLLLAMQSATGGEVQVTYDTDYVTRADLTPLPMRSPSPGYAQRRVGVTIPRGRMRGDANGDGYINEWDLSVIYDYCSGARPWPEQGTEDYEAGVNVFGDGTPLNILNYQTVYVVIQQGNFGQWPEVTGNWHNIHAPAGAPQFYTDIAIPADEVLQWGRAQVLTDAAWYHSCAIVDGKLRVYANTCPIEAVNLEALLTPALPANYLPADGWRFAEVFRRKPVCRHIRHFQMTLSNEEADQDMAIDAIQVFHTIQDKQR